MDTRPMPSPPSDAASRGLALYSLMAGASALVPVPIVDDWVFQWVRRSLMGFVLRQEGLEPRQEQLRALVAEERHRSFSGCALAVVLIPIKGALYLLKRLLRKLFYVLAVKEAVDRTSQAFLEGYLVREALRRGVVERRELDEDPSVAPRVRQAVRLALKRVGHSPALQAVGGVFRESRRTLTEAARTLTRAWRWARRAGEDTGALLEEEPHLRGVVDRLNTALWHDPELLEKLWHTFRHELQTRLSAQPPGVTEPP